MYVILEFPLNPNDYPMLQSVSRFPASLVILVAFWGPWRHLPPLVHANEYCTSMTVAQITGLVALFFSLADQVVSSILRDARYDGLVTISFMPESFSFLLGVLLAVGAIIILIVISGPSSSAVPRKITWNDETISWKQRGEPITKHVSEISDVWSTWHSGSTITFADGLVLQINRMMLGGNALMRFAEAALLTRTKDR